jgi:predicted nucleic acid-binding protein
VRVVVSDANVLINLIHVDLLGLLGCLPGYEFVVPEQVVVEVTDPCQSMVLQGAISQGVLRIELMDDIEGLALFSELTQTMGRGEAACLSLAVRRGWFLASDERKVFRREALKRIGQDHLLNTPGILLLAIRSGVLTVEAADQAKTRLESLRFRMTFKSFGDLL